MKPNRKIIVSIWCGLSDRQLETKVCPLLECDQVKKVILFRRYPIKYHPKLKQINPPANFRCSTILSLIWIIGCTTVLSLCQRFKKNKSFDFAFGVTAFPHAILARLSGALAGVPCGAWWIGSDLFSQYKKPIIGLLYRKALRSCDLTLVMGSQSKKILLQDGWSPNRVFAFLNAHDLDRFRPRNLPKDWDVINVGRHVKDQKRLHILLYAINIVKKEMPSIRCLMVGDGPDRSRLERIRDVLELNANVTFSGQRVDIPDLLSTSKLYVMCSAWEGLPAAMIEAFCCGLPAVVSNVSDISDFAHHGGNAVLMDADAGAEKYASEILRVLSDDKLREVLIQGAMETRERLVSINPRRQAKEFWSEYFSMLH